MEGDAKTTSSRARVLRASALTVFCVVMAYRWSIDGVPGKRTPLFAWILTGVAIAAVGRRGSRAMRFFWDWAPMIVLLALYDISRGLADESGMPVQMESLVRIEERLFGSPIPTVRLQADVLMPDGPVHWWELAIAVCYTSHFVVSLGLLIILWLVKRADFLVFRRQFITITLLGLTGYFLVPSAPPWMAAREGIIEPVRRMSLRGFQVIGGEGPEKAITAGTRLSNPVAAMPSLHAGWSLLVALFVFRYLPRWAWPIALAYPALMMFTLVSSGEHYVIDVLAGFGCAGIAVALTDGWQRREERRRNSLSQ